MVPVLPKVLDPEESRAKRLEKQQSRYRHRFGTFVPSERNPLLETLLARGVNGESPPHPKRKTPTPSRTSPRKQSRRKSTPLRDDSNDLHEPVKTSKPRKSTKISDQNDGRSSKSNKTSAKSTKIVKTRLLEVAEQGDPGTITNHVKPRAAGSKATSPAAKRRNTKHTIAETSGLEPDPTAKTKTRKATTRSTTVKKSSKLKLAVEVEEYDDDEEEEKEQPKKTRRKLDRTPPSKTVLARDDEDDGKELESKSKHSTTAGDKDSLHRGDQLPIARPSRAKRTVKEVLEEEPRPNKTDSRSKSKRKPTVEEEGHNDGPAAKKVKVIRGASKFKKVKADVDKLEQLEPLAQLPKAKKRPRIEEQNLEIEEGDGDESTSNKRVRMEVKAGTGKPKKAEIDQLEKVPEGINLNPATAKRSKIFSKSKQRNVTTLEFPKSNRFSSPLRLVLDEEDDPINFLS